MPSQQVVYIFWRDIPAQFIVGKGRKAKKVKLPNPVSYTHLRAHET